MSQVPLPGWMQWAWSIAGITIAVGGVLWVTVIFWPYLRWSRRVMFESLELARDTSRILEDVQDELRPIIKDVEVTAGKVREAVEKMDIKSEFRRVEDTFLKIERHLSSLSENYGKLNRRVPVPVTTVRQPGGDGR